MDLRLICILIFSTFTIVLISSERPAYSLETENLKNLDNRVKVFLEKHTHTWRDMNISETDGEILYDLIIKNKL